MAEDRDRSPGHSRLHRSGCAKQRYLSKSFQCASAPRVAVGPAALPSELAEGHFRVPADAQHQAWSADALWLPSDPSCPYPRAYWQKFLRAEEPGSKQTASPPAKEHRISYPTSSDPPTEIKKTKAQRLSKKTRKICEVLKANKRARNKSIGLSFTT